MSFPKRTIHLDFHTGPMIPDVGSDFDPEVFAKTFRDAHVDSVTVFATCHHGNAYWSTGRPERHPSLPEGLDLLGEQIRALHETGIKAPIYFSVQCNEFCANAHPEWVAVNPDGTPVRKPQLDFFEPAWQIMDMSSPYQDYLAEQLEEVLDRYGPVDGVFLDMCWDQVSVSKWARAGMNQRGLDPRGESDRNEYARLVAHSYMKRYSDMVKGATEPGAGFGVWFNSRPKVSLRDEQSFIDHVEVESLPTGGWGYTYLPYVARFVRGIDLPGLSHTGRFFKSWGDSASLKPKAALKYECAQILAMGLSNGVGDFLHPRARPSPEVYSLIGEVYDHIRRCEPFVERAKHITEAAIIVDPALGDQPGSSVIGAVRALKQLRVQFDVCKFGDDLDTYRLLVVPESTPVDDFGIKQLERFSGAGGAVIVCAEAVATANQASVRSLLGIRSAKPAPFSHSFIGARLEAGDRPADFPYVMYEPALRLEPENGTVPLADLGESYFERSYEHFSGHSYTPFAGWSKYAAVVRKERIITFGVPLFRAFGKHAVPNYRQLLDNCIDLIMPERIVQDQGPSHMEITVVENEASTVAHVLSYAPERRAEGMDIIEEPIPLVGVPVSIRMDCEPYDVSVQPHGEPVGYQYENGYLHMKLTLLDGHAMIVATRDGRG